MSGLNSTHSDPSVLADPSNVAVPSNLRSARFRADREGDWKRLEDLVRKVESSGVRSLSYHDARDLATTYRQTINSLSVAREISLDQALLGYLENLSARAYLVVYAPQGSLYGLTTQLLRYGIPQAVRRCSLPLLIGFGAMLLGALIGYSLFEQDSAWYALFHPGEMMGARSPHASREAMLGTLYDSDISFTSSLSHFASYLFSHNTQVALMVFSLGVLCSVPNFVLTLYNGILLGAFYAVFADKGLGYDVVGWLSIHGVTEISAICVACAGGAQLGLAILMPGRMSRRDALRSRGRDATKLAILAVLMLVVAAVLEGFFRQLVQSAEVRLFIGWGIGALWGYWLFFTGKEKPLSMVADLKGGA